MFTLIRPVHRPFRPLIISFRLVHNPGKNTPLPQRDWGVVGRLSRAPTLAAEEPPHEEEEGAEDAKNARYQTDNYTPESDPTPLRWAKHRASLKAKFPEGWAPPHKLSRAAMDGLRALHAHDPDTFPTPVLAEKFRISPEAVRRILKSKWEPTKEQRDRFLERERRFRQDRARSGSSSTAERGVGPEETKWKKKAARRGYRQDQRPGE
ncbi:hypothetical protein EDB85DRAFT_1958610 [Lactarius pseudohatsudake]|nr:hypothetical protein EDB85DRAFT_1958610 [Lactarius pseudohatsudake]